MMQSMVSALEAWGIADSHIHFEAFGPASVKRSRVQKALQPSHTESGAAADGEIFVTFAKTDKRLAWQPSDGSLLEFAEAHGVQVDCGCRAGGCGTCQTAIRSGEVKYRQTPDFDPEPGSCLLCVCEPHTDVTLEA